MASALGRVLRICGVGFRGLQVEGKAFMDLGLRLLRFKGFGFKAQGLGVEDLRVVG